jgi:AraC family transcriptional activator of mtrCDE
MDILDDILETLKLKGALYFRTDFSGPWGVTVPDLGQAARFHLVVQGQCRVELASGQTADLGPGDMIMIPKGQSHILADAPGRGAPPLEAVLEAAGYEGSGVLAVGEGDALASTQLICGHLDFRHLAQHPVLHALPDHLVITAAMRAREPWLDELLRMMTRRVFSDALGSEATVTRLSELMFVEVLRAGIGQGANQGLPMQAFRDQHIGCALELIHRAPEKPWTVGSLASATGMSRSRFAERFRELLGVAPVGYLSDWRLQKALSLLEDSQCSVQQVASRSGYKSSAAFSRAFTGKFGRPPTAFRRVGE